MYTDHTLIIKELERSIKFNNWNSILSFLPKGSFLVGGFIRDIILGRVTEEIDIDIEFEYLLLSFCIDSNSILNIHVEY